MSLLQRHTNFLYIVLGLSVLFAIILAIVLLSQSFGQSYSQQLASPDIPQQTELNTQTFGVRRIRLQTEGDCGEIEISRNGQASKLGCDTRLENRIFLSNENLQRLFGNLTKDEFDQLQELYYLPGLAQNLTITIETNYGTKTVTVSGSDTSAPILDESLEDIIDIIEDVEEDLETPSPTPPPTPIPTPTPSGYIPPSPTPGTTPTPTPTPSPGGGSQEAQDPFDCEMLEQKGVTVSNIRCLEADDL